MTRHIPRRTSERVRTSYLGFGWEIVGESSVTVFHPDGIRLGRGRSVPAARRLVRAYRRLERSQV